MLYFCILSVLKIIMEPLDTLDKLMEQFTREKDDDDDPVIRPSSVPDWMLIPRILIFIIFRF